MAQPVTLKVYGNIFPATKILYETIASICLQAIPPASCRLDGDILLISFEGLYFPVKDVLEIIESVLSKDQQGKLDVLDLEGWKLERYIFANGAITSKCAPLNNVLDYSGH